ncbi:MAG TPA: TolC family protein [Spirochaetia bacterium]|nr:TolC family protein [Spirochaetia bacterium]
MFSSTKRGILIYLILLPAAAAAAQDTDNSALSVRLSDAALEALQASPVVWEARLQWLIRKTQVQGAWGNFEPALVSGVSRDYQDRLNTAEQALSMFNATEFKEQRTEYQVGVEGKFFSGAGYRLGYSLVDTTGNLVTAPVYPAGHQYESNLSVQVDQPLLKGIARGSPLIPVRLARNEELIAFHTYRREMISVVSKVESAYWDLALAQELHRIAAESVRMAQEIAADARERLGVGKMSDLDLSEAEIQLAIRVTEEESSVLAVSEAAAQLRLLLGGGRIGSTASITAAEPLEVESPSGVVSSDQGDTRVQEALKLQPEILISRGELEKSGIQLDYRLDQRLPELNAHASFGLQGLDNSFNGSLDRLQSESYPTWSLGLQFRLPILGNLQAQSQLEEARLTRELAARKMRAMERDTSISTAALFQRVLSYARQAENARAVSGFKKRLLDVEMTRFDTGKSDIRRLYDAEQALSEARKTELEGYRRFRRAAADLAAASGTTLRDKGLESMEGELINLSPVLLSDPWK